MKVTGWPALLLMTLAWLFLIIGYTALGVVYLDWIGHFGFSLRELMGIAGVLSGLTIASHTSNS